MCGIWGRYRNMSILNNPYISERTKSIFEKYDVDFVFQPIFSKFETIVGYEALMRPKGKSILAFIEEMKQSNRLHELEILTFFGATHAYQKRGYDTLLSINSFPTEIFTKDELIEYTQCFEMPREKVVVEMLEYADEKNWTWGSKSKQINSNTGVEVALDDFGTGFNDEEAIEYYKPNMIKIDRSLISNIDKDEKKQSRLSKIVSDMHEKMIVVLAEGIETKEEFEIVKKIGVDFFQGYYLGMPA